MRHECEYTGKSESLSQYSGHSINILYTIYNSIYPELSRYSNEAQKLESLFSYLKNVNSCNIC